MSFQTKVMGKEYLHSGTSTNNFVNCVRMRRKETIEILVKEYNKQLVNTALGLGFSMDVAFDVVQNTWCTFMDIAPRFEGRSHIRTFLFGILYNKAKEMRKEQTRFDTFDPIEKVLEERFDSAGNWLSYPTNPESLLLAMEKMEMIEKCIGSLPFMQKTVFSLRQVQNLSSKEICDIMDITISNLGVLLFRAKNRLRECIINNSKEVEK